MKKKTYKHSLCQGFIDTDTGEVIKQTVVTEVVEGYKDLKLPEKHKINNGNFIVLFQKAMYEISINHHLFTRNEFVLLTYLIGTAGIGNSIYIDYPTLTDELKIKRPNIVTAINSLVKKGIIVKNKAKLHRSRSEAVLMQMSLNFDQLNYNLAYVGKFKEHSRLKGTHPPITLLESDNPGQMNLLDVPGVIE